MTAIEVWIEADDVTDADAVLLATRATKFLTEYAEGVLGYEVTDEGHTITDAVSDE